MIGVDQITVRKPKTVITLVDTFKISWIMRERRGRRMAARKPKKESNLAGHVKMAAMIQKAPSK